MYLPGPENDRSTDVQGVAYGINASDAVVGYFYNISNSQSRAAFLYVARFSK
jgi:hypothetical protein